MRRRIGIVVGVAILGVGCSSSSSGSGPTQCSQRSGTFREDYTERSGTCGAISEQIITIAAQPTAPPAPCTGGSIQYSGDNCKVTEVNVTCPEPGIGAGYTSVTNGTANWSGDGGSGTAILQIVVHNPDGTIACQSSYDVTFTKQ